MLADTVPLQLLEEIDDTVKTALWVGDCFVYTTQSTYHRICVSIGRSHVGLFFSYANIRLLHTKDNRLNYYVGGEVVTVSHMDRCVLEFIDPDLASCLMPLPHTTAPCTFWATCRRRGGPIWVTRI